LHGGNNPERANAAQAPAPLGANLRLTPFLALLEEAGFPAPRSDAALRKITD
jgi:hypothetical protein